MTSRLSAPRQRTDGFTTVELVLTLLLVGILGAVSIPRFVRVGDFNERFFFDDVVVGLRHAQKLAVATGCPVQVDFTGAGFVLTQRAACATGAFDRPVIDPGDGGTGFAETAPDGVAVASSVDPLVFDALGRALDGGGAVGDATVTVGARTIIVVGDTGYVDGG